MADLPETVLQFGGGNFLRAFADLFINQVNQTPTPVGGVVVVQSTDSDRAERINSQKGCYHVVLRGLDEGCRVDKTIEVGCISRAIEARNAWTRIVDVAQSEDLRFIISNTTEAGLSLTEEDRRDGVLPVSFPAKLLVLLESRFQAGCPGVTVLPCELVEKNGDCLRGLVLKQADRWGLDADLRDWVEQKVIWLNTLVDRIVSGRPDQHPLLMDDSLLTVAEPYAMWAIEQAWKCERMFEHPAIRRVEDVAPFSLRKVRILNAAHIALVLKAMPLGIGTVREAIEHPNIGSWLRRLLFQEIVPTLEDVVDEPAEFAEKSLERFANPFLDHRLADIALHREDKVRVRLEPSYQAFVSKFGEKPPILGELLGR
ncbi:MAG TPA: altronate dehydrogenase [Candidatus Latescibacteria bacterium]|nr:altronate dehydrogenase [Candidatus Latescibacterota bacterium]|tara:strand:+ start:390 stop:1502 length:1113 start_codon:yes stop_codon:yes gene_type:complete